MWIALRLPVGMLGWSRFIASVGHNTACEARLLFRHMKTWMTIVCSMSIFAFGCSKPSQSDSITLQGTWITQEPGATNAGVLVFQGANLVYHGPDTNEWLKGTFSLREDTKPKRMVAVLFQCGMIRYVGKRWNGIYQIRHGKLTIAVHEPGDPTVPASFDEPGIRPVEFKKK